MTSKSNLIVAAALLTASWSFAQNVIVVDGTGDNSSFDFSIGEMIIGSQDGGTTFHGVPNGSVTFDFFTTTGSDIYLFDAEILSLGANVPGGWYNETSIGSDTNPPDPGTISVFPQLAHDAYVTTPGATFNDSNRSLAASELVTHADLEFMDGPQTNFPFARVTLIPDANGNAAATLRGTLQTRLDGPAIQFVKDDFWYDFSIGTGVPTPPTGPPTGPPTNPPTNPTINAPTGPGAIAATITGEGITASTGITALTGTWAPVDTRAIGAAGGTTFDLFLDSATDFLVMEATLTVERGNVFNDTDPAHAASDSAPPFEVLKDVFPELNADLWITTPGDTAVAPDMTSLAAGEPVTYFDFTNDGAQSAFHWASVTLMPDEEGLGLATLDATIQTSASPTPLFSEVSVTMSLDGEPPTSPLTFTSTSPPVNPPVNPPTNPPTNPPVNPPVNPPDGSANVTTSVVGEGGITTASGIVESANTGTAGAAGGYTFDLFLDSADDVLVIAATLDVEEGTVFNDTNPAHAASDTAPPLDALTAIFPELNADLWITTPGRTSAADAASLAAGESVAHFDTTDEGAQSGFHWASLTLLPDETTGQAAATLRATIQTAGSPTPLFDEVIVSMGIGSATVPEPTSFGLVMTALLGGLGMVRRKRS